MLAYKITINQNVPVIIGVEDWVVFSATIGAGRNKLTEKPEFHCHYGGLSIEKEHGYGEHFRWKLPNVQIGDTVIIEIIESEIATPPTKRYRSDREVEESSFTEEEEKKMRYDEYLELKAEFENEK